MLVQHEKNIFIVIDVKVGIDIKQVEVKTVLL